MLFERLVWLSPEALGTLSFTVFVDPLVLARRALAPFLLFRRLVGQFVGAVALVQVGVFAAVPGRHARNVKWKAQRKNFICRKKNRHHL